MKPEWLISYQGIAGLVSKVQPLVDSTKEYTLAVNGPSPEWTQHLQARFASGPHIKVSVDRKLSENVALLKEVTS